jgi:hypothetical protein
VERVSRVDVSDTVDPEASVWADLDTLVIAVSCAACALFPAEQKRRRGRPQLIPDNEPTA